MKKNLHHERCQLVKLVVKELLEKIYGKVEVNYKFDNIGSKPDDFKGFEYQENLIQVYEKLLEQTNGNEFVKSSTLPNCDFYVPSIKTIVEFDESQHFTNQRKQSLLLYPESLKTGFNKDKWINLCESINAKMQKKTSPYRDEQRAWYDCVRDIMPSYSGLNPTVRLYSMEYSWCRLSPDNKTDLEKFKSFIE
jgi:hypothetical protein